MQQIRSYFLSCHVFQRWRRCVISRVFCMTHLRNVTDEIMFDKKCCSVQKICYVTKDSEVNCMTEVYCVTSISSVTPVLPAVSPVVTVTFQADCTAPFIWGQKSHLRWLIQLCGPLSRCFKSGAQLVSFLEDLS